MAKKDQTPQNVILKSFVRLKTEDSENSLTP